jgi:hypothetical protein
MDPALEELFDDLHDSGDLDHTLNKAQGRKQHDVKAAGVSTYSITQRNEIC